MPPANRLGAGIEGFELAVLALFVLDLSPFIFIGSADTGWGGTGAMMPPPVVGRHHRERAQGSEQKSGEERKNQSLHKDSPLDISSMRAGAGLLY
jgi:hypothetical protein